MICACGEPANGAKELCEQCAEWERALRAEPTGRGICRNQGCDNPRIERSRVCAGCAMWDEVAAAATKRTTAASTKRYAHLTEGAVRVAAERVSGDLAAGLDGGSAAVIDLRLKA